MIAQHCKKISPTIQICQITSLVIKSFRVVTFHIYFHFSKKENLKVEKKKETMLKE